MSNICTFKLNEENKENLENLEYVCNEYNTHYNLINEQDKKDKKKFFDKENEIRMNIDKTDDDISYIIDENGKLILNQKIFLFFSKRKEEINLCIKKIKRYIDNPTENSQLEAGFNLEEKGFDALLLKFLEDEQERLSKINETNTIKEICTAFHWGLDNKESKQFTGSQKFHGKTISLAATPNAELKHEDRQCVLGHNIDTIDYRASDRIFYNKLIYITNSMCSKYVMWNMIVNKYYVLTRYYTNAKFIRFILPTLSTLPTLPTFYVAPFRRYPPAGVIDRLPARKKSEYIGDINMGPFHFEVYNNSDNSNNIDIYPNGIRTSKYILYDDSNHIIKPPLLRSGVTVTYTEFKDLLIYLNLPVFRSTVNKKILFFPNYDEHKKLIDIHNKYNKDVKVYIDNRKPIENKIVYAWFTNKYAMEEVNKYCNQFREEDGACIEPVDYRWYQVMFGTVPKKYIFLVTNLKECRQNYTNSSYFINDSNEIFMYNDVINDHALDALNQQCKLQFRRPKSYEPKSSEPKSYQDKYIKYKTKYYLLKQKLSL